MISARQSSAPPQQQLLPDPLCRRALFAAAIFLVSDPGILWTRWLAWPAAGVACLFGAVGIYHAFDKKNETISADNRGVTIRARSDTREFSWGMSGR